MTYAKGFTGQVDFDGDFVRITRKGFLARTGVGKGQKTIPLSSVAAVQWKPAGFIMNGYIEFSIPGGKERLSKFGSATVDAVNNENSVVFTRRQQGDFEILRDAVESALVAH